MKAPVLVAAAAIASTALAFPTVEIANSIRQQQKHKNNGASSSMTTYAVSGFRIGSVDASIRPYSIFKTTATSSVDFVVQPLDVNGLGLGDGATCVKTWTDSLFGRSTSTVVVACSDPNLTFNTRRNWFRFWEFNVNLSYQFTNNPVTTSPPSDNGTTTPPTGDDGGAPSNSTPYSGGGSSGTVGTNSTTSTGASSDNGTTTVGANSTTSTGASDGSSTGSANSTTALFLRRHRASSSSASASASSSASASASSSSSSSPTVALYTSQFALNEKSSAYKCVRDRSRVQQCVANGGNFLAATTSEKKIS